MKELLQSVDSADHVFVPLSRGGSRDILSEN